jgi:hypothetical protein
MFVTILFDCDSSLIKVVPKYWVQNLKKTINKSEFYLCYFSQNLNSKPNFDKSTYYRKFEGQEGIYKVFLKGEFGKYEYKPLLIVKIAHLYPFSVRN